MKELKKGIIESVQDSIDLTDNQVSISTLNIMLDEILPEQLRLYFVSQQRKLLIGLLTRLEKDGGNEWTDKEYIVNKYLANL